MKGPGTESYRGPVSTCLDRRIELQRLPPPVALGSNNQVPSSCDCTGYTAVLPTLWRALLVILGFASGCGCWVRVKVVVAGRSPLSPAKAGTAPRLRARSAVVNRVLTSVSHDDGAADPPPSGSNLAWLVDTHIT